MHNYMRALRPPVPMHTVHDMCKTVISVVYFAFHFSAMAAAAKQMDEFMRIHKSLCAMSAVYPTCADAHRIELAV